MILIFSSAATFGDGKGLERGEVSKLAVSITSYNSLANVKGGSEASKLQKVIRSVVLLLPFYLFNDKNALSLFTGAEQVR